MIRSKLKVVLADRGVGQQELSKRTGVRLPTISDICTGKVKHFPMSALDAICKELHCQPGDILEYLPDPEERGAKQP